MTAAVYVNALYNLVQYYYYAYNAINQESICTDIDTTAAIIFDVHYQHYNI